AAATVRAIFLRAVFITPSTTCSDVSLRVRDTAFTKIYPRITKLAPRCAGYDVSWRQPGENDGRGPESLNITEMLDALQVRVDALLRRNRQLAARLAQEAEEDMKRKKSAEDPPPPGMLFAEFGEEVDGA